MMNADTIAEQLLEGTGLSVIDLARLALGTIEELGGRRRKNVLVRLRTVMRAGVQAVKDAERTVCFRKAAEQSIAERRDLRPTSLRDIRHYVRRFLRDARFAARPLRAISTRECRELLQSEFGHSPSSFVKARAILSSVFSFGIRQEWCDANPVSRITVPRVQETPIEPLTQEEILRLETTVEQPRFRDMKFSLHLLLYNGIRPTEVSRLRPEDIDKHARLIRIRSQVCKTGGGRILPLRGSIEEHDICIPAGGTTVGVSCAARRAFPVGCLMFCAIPLPAITPPISAISPLFSSKWGIATSPCSARVIFPPYRLKKLRGFGEDTPHPHR